MDRGGPQAAGFLASYLTMANTAEFRDGIDRILSELDRNRFEETEVLREVRTLRESMTSSSTERRKLRRDDDRLPGGADVRLLPGARV